MPDALTDAAIQTALASLPGWACEGDALCKTFRFGDFKEAFCFMTRVAFEAEALSHHPEWTNVYSRVAIRLWTHDAGDRVTALDVKLATAIEGL